MTTENDEIKALVGVTLQSITGMEKGSDEIDFTTVEGRRFRMWHSQDCCEHVELADVIGDAADLIGSPIITAEARTNSEDDPPEYADSWTWTFYELATSRGSVTLRWLGESNGYYSESVDFSEVTN